MVHEGVDIICDRIVRYLIVTVARRTKIFQTELQPSKAEPGEKTSIASEAERGRAKRSNSERCRAELSVAE